MPDVFTTLTMVKMRLNDGEIPAMEELTDRAKKICDPEFTPGMGALDADPDTTKLRCPVRGCGEYYHRLGYHLTTVHDDIGGPDRIKRALSLPRSAPLTSPQYRQKIQERAQSSGWNTPPDSRRCKAETKDGGRCRSWACEDSGGELCYLHWIHDDPERSRQHAQKAAKSFGSNHGKARTGVRNFNNSCRAQIAQRILSVKDRVGRVPSTTEANNHDPTLVSAAQELYGTWDAALADCNLQSRKPRQKYQKDDLIELTSAFYEEHGRLPKVDEAGNGAIPPVPSPKPFYRAFDCESWIVAMRRVAFHLGVESEMYDIPLDSPITTDEAAEILGVSYQGAYAALRRNSIEPEKAMRDTDHRVMNYWERSKVEALAKERQTV